MAVFNAAKREIDIKIVYYGPALCGKTTNVQCIHRQLSPDQRGEIMSLATKDDRTLFFDFLPIELGDIKGFKTRFHVYTVPGQVYYVLTRRAVLTGVDGVVFVADSQDNKMEENLESLKDLNENLKYYKKDLTTVPFIIQYNKRDLDNVLSIDELNTALNVLNVPCFESSAVEGTGVIETLTECCKLVLRQMNDTSTQKREYKEERLDVSAGDDVCEPIIRITSEVSTTAPLEEPTPGSGEIGDIHQMSSDGVETTGNIQKIPSVESLRLEEPEIYDNIEPEIKIDSSSVTSDMNEFDDSVGGIVLEGEAPSLELEEEKSVSGHEPAITLHDDVPFIKIEGEHESVSFQGAETAQDSLTVGIQGETVSDVRIISCGQAKKVSDTGIKLPIVFKIDQEEKEFMVNLCITFDEFKLKT